MSPGTSAQLRRRHDARKQALARQHELNADIRRRDEQELDLAVDFAVLSEQRASAQAALQASELALGQVVDTLIGELRIRYPRAAQLLETPEDELKRLRQLVTDHATQNPPATRASPPRRPGRPARTGSGSATPGPPPPTTPPADQARVAGEVGTGEVGAGDRAE